MRTFFKRLIAIGIALMTPIEAYPTESGVALLRASGQSITKR
jgi:hypothetical protein